MNILAGILGNNVKKTGLITVAAFLLKLVASSVLADVQAPTIDQKDDLKHLVPSGNAILFWTREQQVAGYRNMVKLAPTRIIARGDYVLELPRKKVDLDGIEIEALDGKLTLDQYFNQQSVAGLLVVKNGNIVYERYGLGNTEDSVWISFSVAKSVVSLLVGAAVQDGYIKSLDEKITAYLPRLTNSSYDQSSIKNILQMSSGVKWNEDYADPESDVARATYVTLSLYEYLRELPRESAPGEKFNYNTAETNLVGTFLRSAIGNNLATYLSDKIWKPFGMEFDAYWQLTEPGGGEFGGCCINATLRDYARIGLFALANGKLKDGSQVLPDNWMKDSITPSKGYEGYGYLWWLRGGGAYQASGIFGQGIYINPQENLVIALHSAREKATNREDSVLQGAMIKAVAAALHK